MNKNPVLAITLVLVLAMAAFVIAPQAEAKKGESSIAEIVVSNPDVTGDGEGDFDTLLVAVLAADPSVLERLSNNGQNTVFAPTDDAFAAAFEELAELGIMPGDILGNPELLTLILNYHISPGYRTADTVLKSQQIRMRDGGFLSQSGGVLTDNLGRDANIIVTDIAASNGNVHVIDNVVLPGLP
jgi:uncharacterized surface protein with fasciclin (FAS1) repeats